MTVIRSERELRHGRPLGETPVSTRLRGHWQALREGNALPRRDQFEPRALAPLLASVFLIDWTEQGAARLRIAGQVFAHLYGMELHGAPLALLVEPSQRAEIGRLVRTVCEDPVALDLGMWSEGSSGTGTVRPALAARMMMLPILDRNGARTLAIGSLEVTGMIGRAPRRFRIERCLRTPLVVD